LGTGPGPYARGTHSLIDPSGTAIFIAYQATDSSPDGVVRLTPTDCKKLPTPGISPTVLAESGGKIWLLDVAGSALGYLDPVTEVTTIVSRPPDRGAGSAKLGGAALHVASASAWTLDRELFLAYTRVDTANGDREALAGVEGPAALHVEHPPFAWLDPKGVGLVLALDGAIVTLDPTNGASQIVSY
jgi:hypothetical protein